MRIPLIHHAFAALGLLLAATAPAQTTRPFLFGGDFNPKSKPEIYKLFYDSGMNCVRLTGGGYGWAAGMHKSLADEFQQRGLHVYLQLGSHYPSADYFRLKEAWLVDQAGKSGVEDRKAWSISYSGHHWPQYAYTSQPFRKQLEKDFASYLKSFAANTNVAGVILHNEPGYFWQSDRIYDYSPGTVAAFRPWLETQHGDIATLNQRWGSSYTSFAEVVPPGKPPVQQIGAWMDWRRFQVAAIGNFLDWEASFFKQQRPDVPRTTNLAGPLDHWYGYRCADNLRYSQPMDVVGVDIYPTRWSDRMLVPYTMDLSHGVAAGRDVHVVECDVFSPKLWKDFSESQRADMLRGELWTMVGHGARAILMWGFSRGDDFSLTDGDANERYLAARDIAQHARMIGLDDFKRPQPSVALCVDPDSYLYFAGIEAKSHQLTAQEDAEAHGLYAALADSHISADVIMTPQLTTGALDRYKAIVLAGSQLMDDKTARELERFVGRGGILIADTPLATHDRWGKPQASPDLATLFAAGRKNTLLLGQRAGVAYMNQPSAGLRRQLDAALSPVLATPRALASEAQVNTSILRDTRGRLLVVASVLGGKGAAAPAVENLTLTLTQSPHITRAFLLTSSASPEGKAQATELPITRAGDSVHLAVGKLTSAAAILLLPEGAAPPAR